MPIWFFTPIKMKLLSICLRIYAKCFKCVIQLSLVSKIWFPKYMVIVFYAIKKCFAIYVGLQIISKWDTDAICAWPCPLSKKKKYQYSKHSSEFFWLLSVRNFFSQGIYKSNPLTFLWEKNWAFWKSYIKPNLWQIVIWSKSVWHPKWQKNWSKNWKKKKKNEITYL